MRFIQHNCIEGNDIDTRQADAVRRHAPHVILFESPRNTRSLGWSINGASLEERVRVVKEHKKHLRVVAQTYPWVWSEAFVLDNVVDLWKAQQQVDLYNVDAPSELLRQTIIHRWNQLEKPRRRGVHFPWWVYIYLRERMMADTVKQIIPRYREPDTLALVAMQKFHWLHVQFLLTQPSKQKIFTYYFAAFPNVFMHTLNKKVEGIGNPVLLKYWRTVSDFVE